MVGVAERPGLVRVKVRVSTDAGAGEVGVSQETSLTVERRAVTMETRGEEDHDVGLLPLILDLRVRHLLSGKRQSRGWASVTPTYIMWMFLKARQSLYDRAAACRSGLTWKESGVTVCHTLKACRIALWVSFSPTLGVKLEMLQEAETETLVRASHSLNKTMEGQFSPSELQVGSSSSFRTLSSWRESPKPSVWHRAAISQMCGSDSEDSLSFSLSNVR